MKIELPHTLAARYDVTTSGWNCPFGGTGTVVIMFGSWPILELEITENGERFEDDNSFYRSAENANEHLSEFVAQWLKKIFQNALSIGG